MEKINYKQNIIYYSIKSLLHVKTNKQECQPCIFPAHFCNQLLLTL